MGRVYDALRRAGAISRRFPSAVSHNNLIAAKPAITALVPSATAD